METAGRVCVREIMRSREDRQKKNKKIKKAQLVRRCMRESMYELFRFDVYWMMILIVLFCVYI